MFRPYLCGRVAGLGRYSLSDYEEVAKLWGSDTLRREGNFVVWKERTSVTIAECQWYEQLESFDIRSMRAFGPLDTADLIDRELVAVVSPLASVTNAIAGALPRALQRTLQTAVLWYDVEVNLKGLIHYHLGTNSPLRAITYSTHPHDNARFVTTCRFNGPTDIDRTWSQIVGKQGSSDHLKLLSIGLASDGEIEITKDYHLMIDHVDADASRVAAKLQKLSYLIPAQFLSWSEPHLEQQDSLSEDAGDVEQEEYADF